jgi:hypothetical protein
LSEIPDQVRDDRFNSQEPIFDKSGVEIRMKLTDSEVIAGLFWLAVGILFAAGGMMMSLGSLRNPGPGFLPLMMALLLVAFSLVILARRAPGPARVLKKTQWKSQTALVAAVFLYGLLLNLAGFLFSTFVLMLVLFGLSFEGKCSWWRVLCYAAATAFIGWLVFSVTLKVPFPRGHLMAIGR